MLDSPILIVFAVLAALGIGIGVFSIRRRKRIRNLCSQAARAIQEGRHDDALRILLTAEQSWAFNSHNGGRSSCLSDLEDLSQILMLLAHLRGGDSSRIAQVESAVSELRNLFAERGNFGINGRSMKQEAAIRWPELSDRLESLRHELRRSYATKVAA